MKSKLSFLPLLLLTFLFISSCNEGGNDSSSAQNSEEAELFEEIPSPAEEESSEKEIYKIPPAIDTTISVAALGNSINNMRYSTNEIRVPANGRIKVILENRAEDPELLHNIVFVKKNSVKEVASMGETAGKEKSFVPDLPAVFAGSELAEPGETVELLFTAPHQSGEYAFICTFPGHWQEMNGRFLVETVAN